MVLEDSPAANAGALVGQTFMGLVGLTFLSATRLSSSKSLESARAGCTHPAEQTRMGLEGTNVFPTAELPDIPGSLGAPTLARLNAASRSSHGTTYKQTIIPASDGVYAFAPSSGG